MSPRRDLHPPLPDLGAGAQEFTLEAADGTALHGAVWRPRGQVRGVLMVLHGMNEHIARYQEFARALAEAGWAVVAHDQRGHGRTNGSLEHIVHLGDAPAWDATVGDVLTVTRYARTLFPGVPLVWMGHSFGSFVARAATVAFGGLAQGVVLMGTSAIPTAAQRLGGLYSSVLSRVVPPHVPARLLDTVNTLLLSGQEKHAWLSSDRAEQRAFAEDPWCGNVPTLGFYRDIVSGMREVNRPEAFAAVPAELPVLIVSGQEDALAFQSHGVRWVAGQLRQAGVQDVTLTLYPQARHEILHDDSRAQVTGDILAWCEDLAAR